MLRITIEEVPEAQAVPRGPARRESDLLYPQAMMEPRILFQQSWVDGEEGRPDRQQLVGFLNDLAVPEPCATCGHPKDEHSRGESECNHHGGYDMGRSERCRCPIYMTKMEKWNQGVLRAHDESAKQIQELRVQLVDTQSGVLLPQIESILPELIAKTKEALRPKRKARKR